MWNIIKYEEAYLVTYKDGTTEQISKQWWQILIKQLVDKQWVVVNWNWYNRFEIISCKKITRDWSINDLLNQETTLVQDKVKEYMKLDKRELTPWRLQNMILKAKKELWIQK